MEKALPVNFFACDIATQNSITRDTAAKSAIFSRSSHLHIYKIQITIDPCPIPVAAILTGFLMENAQCRKKFSLN